MRLRGAFVTTALIAGIIVVVGDDNDHLAHAYGQLFICHLPGPAITGS